MLIFNPLADGTVRVQLFNRCENCGIKFLSCRLPPSTMFQQVKYVKRVGNGKGQKIEAPSGSIQNSSVLSTGVEMWCVAAGIVLITYVNG